ncbi:MAG TPA: hypothetical protein VKU40_13120 [Thermoanaerobaculia bacterium]|nr:hypothetical protein [Thermoanaerobaculia bacterium]
MHRKTLVALVAALSVLVAGIASAGTVYLPLAINQEIDGTFYRTLLWATNTGGTATQIEVRFIDTNTDGVEGGQVRKVTVPPGASVPIGNQITGNGFAEITADDNIVFVAELKSFDADGQPRSSASVPLVDAENLMAADQRSHLLALERSVDASATNLGLVNLSPEEAECTIRAFRPEGNQIQGTARIAMPPLGHREFPDAFGILGEVSIDGARLEASCNAPYYAYATLFSEQPDALHFVTAASGGPAALASPIAGGTLMNVPGNFFTSTIPSPIREFVLPIEAGQQFASITVEFDVATQRFPTDLFTATVGLLRPVTGGLYWNHTVRAGGRFRSVLDMGVGDGLVHRGQTNVWTEFTNYRVVAIYDTTIGVIDFQVYRGNQLVEQLVGAIGKFDLSHNGEGIRLVFGLSKVYDNAFFPPYNWRFSNLRVSGVPAV